MEVVLQTVAAENCEQVSPGRSTESFNEVFKPKNTLDQPCDVVLVVEDGKEFKAHRKVLSEASPFFEKLLNSDMKESIEGIVRLEMFAESVVGNALEFIYTGHVQILQLTEGNARDLIVLADYLFLHKLKTLAGEGLAQNLNISNCISTYHFSNEYRCEELLFNTKKFILVNFSAIFAVNREAFLKMSNKEVEMWISSDEIDVGAEEDVFKFILAWIEHDRCRRKYFAEFFGHVRLVYVSRDFLCSDIVTNDLVKDNECCLDLVQDAIDSIDSKNCDRLSFLPRKSLETPVIVMDGNKDILCYFPRENSFCRLGEMQQYDSRTYYNFFPCEGKLYISAMGPVDYLYNLYSNSWSSIELPYAHASLDGNNFYMRHEIFVRNEDEIYIVMYEHPHRDVPQDELAIMTCMKYKPVSNSWELISSFDHLRLRHDFCLVAKDNFIYFIGGRGWHDDDREWKYLTKVDRYDLCENQWDKVADIHVARNGEARGAVVNGKIFIADGVYEGPSPHQIEVYDETSNEWQLIASFNIRPDAFINPVAADGKLYAVITTREILSLGERLRILRRIRIEYYNPEKNEWKMKTETVIDLGKHSDAAKPCAVRIFKGFCNIRQLETFFSFS